MRHTRKGASMLLMASCVVVACLIPPAACARGDWAINLGQWSWHPDGADNDVHDLIALEYRGWMIGRMVNSYDRTSVMVGYHLQRPVTDWLKVGLRLGAATGYQESWLSFTGEGIQPSALLSAFLHWKGVGVEVNTLPPVFVSIGFRWEF